MSQQLDLFRVRTPRPKYPMPCIVCAKPILHDDPATARHVGCMAKPKPCECGAASMPYPNCTHCKGSGRLPDGDVCPLCPPGPCIECVSKELMKRIRDGRTQAA